MKKVICYSKPNVGNIIRNWGETEVKWGEMGGEMGLQTVFRDFLSNYLRKKLVATILGNEMISNSCIEHFHPNLNIFSD